MAGYTRLEDHRPMLFDAVRNGAYADAIVEAVTPDSVVVDLGAGLGLHGMLAARAGARKVYLVEPEPILEITRRIVAANNLNNVELLAACGEELEVPEPVDLLISVFTGNFLLSEDLLPSLFAARDRCLAPDGIMLPDLTEMQVAPVSAANFHDEVVACWAASDPVLRGLDYCAAQRYAANTAYHEAAVKIEPELLAPAETLMELNLRSADKAECHHRIEVKVSRDGICHGWMGWFRMRLGSEWLSTSPEVAATHWSQVMLPLDPPLQLAAGDNISLDLRRPQYGDWVWKTCCGQQQQQASTFLSVPPALGKLQKAAEQYQPLATNKAQVGVFVLSRFDGNTSSDAIAAGVQSRWPAEFRDSDDALRFVRRLVEKFG